MKDIALSMPIQARFHRCQTSMNGLLQRFLPEGDSPLYEAMHYACLNGGKRLRPLLVFTTAEIFKAPWEGVEALATAIELIHCYSLIHDDLPAMDNDDLRRGKPTCHKVFGEATAILTGDALLALAFEILSKTQHFPLVNESAILKILGILSQAAGPKGMVLGQSLDLAAEGQILTQRQLDKMHLAKTGALITASVQCSALATGLASENNLSKLQKFGEAIGLGFQIKDDILDAEGTFEIMGKIPGQDVKKQKNTYPHLFGLARSKSLAAKCQAAAVAALEDFGESAEPLRALSQFMIERSL